MGWSSEHLKVFARAGVDEYIASTASLFSAFDIGEMNAGKAKILIVQRLENGPATTI